MMKMHLLKLFSCIIVCLNLHAQEPLHEKVLFDNSLMTKNYYDSEAKYTAPSWIRNENQKIPVTNTVFFTPGNALELNYTSADKGQWEANIFYRPARGVDFFVKAKHLCF